MPAAEAMFRQAAGLKPDYANPLLNLAGIRTYESADDPDIAAVRRLLDDPRAPSRGRSFLLFALGKMYDDCGAFDEAFASYRAANALVAAEVRYHAARRRAFCHDYDRGA